MSLNVSRFNKGEQDQTCLVTFQAGKISLKWVGESHVGGSGCFQSSVMLVVVSCQSESSPKTTCDQTCSLLFNTFVNVQFPAWCIPWCVWDWLLTFSCYDKQGVINTKLSAHDIFTSSSSLSFHAHPPNRFPGAVQTSRRQNHTKDLHTPQNWLQTGNRPAVSCCKIPGLFDAAATATGTSTRRFIGAERVACWTLQVGIIWKPVAGCLVHGVGGFKSLGACLFDTQGWEWEWVS